MIKFKTSVQCPKSAIIVAAVANAREELQLGSTYVTSMNDSMHMRGSRHYQDEAVDFRTRDLTTEQINAWAKAVRRRLGKGYQAVIESDLLHVEFDPA